MSIWNTVIVASLAVMALKLIGYVVPTTFGEQPAVQRMSSVLTVALLSSLVVIQTVASNGGVAIDARVISVIVAGVLLMLRAPFIIVVIVAAATAALLRFTGVMP